MKKLRPPSAPVSTFVIMPPSSPLGGTRLFIDGREVFGVSGIAMDHEVDYVSVTKLDDPIRLPGIRAGTVTFTIEAAHVEVLSYAKPKAKKKGRK